MAESISFDRLSFRYRNSESYALKGVTGSIGEGKFVAIMGHEGAGKSTLCFCLNGIVPHFFKGDYSGKTLVNGLEVKKELVSDMAKRVGIVFQDFETQLFSTNVELEMAFGLENLCLRRDEIKRRIDYYLSFVDLNELKNRDISTLSGGQKQRLAIASVLAMEQPILVLDEPLTDLDPEGRRRILKMKDNLKERARVLIMVENDPENIIGSDEIWIMKKGEVISTGRPEDILKNVELLESAGIMVPRHLFFFRKLGLKEIPLTYEESLRLIHEKGYVEMKKERPEIPENICTGGEGIIEFVDVSHIYPNSNYESLKKVNLTIKEGDFVAIVGCNGSGKTTLAKHACGLLIPSKGKVYVRKKDIRTYKRRELASTVGYVFQNPDHQISNYTVFDEVSFGLRMLGIDKKEIKGRVEEALWATGLSGYEELSPFLLSKGERQRVACASILALKPQVLILDEPTTGLDYVHQKSMMEMLKDLNEKGHTIVIITHSPWIVETYATKCVVMKDGRILKEGPTRAVFYDEETLKAASFYPSTLTRIANKLGTKSIKVEEMVEEIKR
jgi:energy-coupling factor transport system ATP-binding protein